MFLYFTAPPDVPSIDKIVMKATSHDKIKFNWKRLPENIYYRISFTREGSSYSKPISCMGYDREYTVTNLLPAKKYYARFRTVKIISGGSNLESDLSEEISASTMQSKFNLFPSSVCFFWHFGLFL